MPTQQPNHLYRNRDTGETAADIADLIPPDGRSVFLIPYAIVKQDDHIVQIEVRATTNGNGDKAGA